MYSNWGGSCGGGGCEGGDCSPSMFTCAAASAGEPTSEEVQCGKMKIVGTLTEISNDKNHRSMTTISMDKNRRLEYIRVLEDGRNLYNEKRVRELFKRAAGRRMTICWHELKEVLEDILKTEFSKEVCRSLISMMDIDNSGKLNYEEFKTLLENIITFSELLKKFDVDKFGNLSATELREAFNFAGYKLSNQLLNTLRFRYATRDDLIAFDDFLMCAIRLKKMIGAFEAKAPKNAKKACFTLDDFLDITLHS